MLASAVCDRAAEAAIAHVVGNNFQIFPLTGGKVVENTYCLASLNESFNQMCTDESCAAGHEKGRQGGLLHMTTGTIKASVIHSRNESIDE